ncbi:MAG TPA: PIN domain-containing protein [Steroidobacteraceae bacterium]|nr:PIN domain-containing protein [Steroidobacteraceae bacterium]
MVNRCGNQRFDVRMCQPADRIHANEVCLLARSEQKLLQVGQLRTMIEVQFHTGGTTAVTPAARERASAGRARWHRARPKANRSQAHPACPLMLVDTSVWVDHLRRGNATLVDLLEQTQVWTHSFVVGELVCGDLAQRAKILGLLAALPHVPVAGHDEALTFVEAHRLMGRGLGWIDVHLLASAKLAKLPFWTMDERLAAAATDLHLRN